MSKTRVIPQSQNFYISFSFLDIFKRLASSRPICQDQLEANRYLNECNSDSDIEDKLKQVIREKNPDLLELFLRGLKKKNISEIALRSPLEFGEKVNSLSFCVGIKFPSLLAVMLHYGANPNAKTWLTNGKEKYVDCPPLLRAFALQSKPAVRLLVLYGATIDKIEFDELIPRLQKFKISDCQKDFYNKVMLEVNQLRLLESQAQECERKENFKAAFEYYRKIGDYNIKLASLCRFECSDNITSRRNLTDFYIRRSLIPYARALYCIEKHLENSSLNSNELADLSFKLKAFQKQILKDADPIMDHDFLNEKMQPINNSWERITQLLDQDPSWVEETYSLLKCR